jgi:hypothetical protein
MQRANGVLAAIWREGSHLPVIVLSAAFPRPISNIAARENFMPERIIPSLLAVQPASGRKPDVLVFDRE